MFVNFAKREVKCKIVYYGPGMSGKTANLQVIHKNVPEKNVGTLTSIATEGDRTLFFDYMPLDIGKVRGMNTQFQLYTVPGQVYYNSTRRIVLQGVDGVVFVADSQKDKLKENIESLKNLEENLSEIGLSITEIPHVIQWNKRDLPTAAEVEFLENNINIHKVSTTEAVASTGEGVLKTLKLIASLVLEKLNKKQGPAQKPTPSNISAARATPAAATQPKEDIEKEFVAKINDIIIKKKDFLNYCQIKYRLYHSKDQNVEDYKNFSKREIESFLDRMINEYLLVQVAKEKGIMISEEMVAAQVSKYKDKFCPDRELDSFLESRNLTKENAQDEAKKTIIINKIVKIIIPDFKEKLKVDENEQNDYFKANENQFQGTFDDNKIRISNILKNQKKVELKEAIFIRLREKSKITKNTSII